MDRIPIRVLIHDPANGPPDLSGFVDPVCIPATMVVTWDKAESAEPEAWSIADEAEARQSGVSWSLERSAAFPNSGVGFADGTIANFRRSGRPWHILPQLATTLEGPAVVTGDLRVDETSRRLLDILAEVGERQGAGQGRHFGTRVHADFARSVRAAKLPGIGDSGVEQSFRRGIVDRYGGSGTVRTDIVLRSEDGRIIAVYDLKTGAAELTPARVAEIRSELNISLSVPIIELRYTTFSTELQ